MGSICQDDWSFEAFYSSCRFDFRLSFEFTALLLAPSLVSVLAATYQIWSLKKASVKISHARALFAGKFINYILITGGALVSLICWVLSDTTKPASSIAALTVGALAAVSFHHYHRWIINHRPRS